MRVVFNVKISLGESSEIINVRGKLMENNET